MLTFTEPNLSAVLTTIGLALDIVGVWILATDLLKQFKGARYEHERDWSVYGIPKTVDGAPPAETTEHQQYQAELLRFRKRGLYLIIVGFAFQLAGVWIKGWL
ncbi:MAG: hypothetical protein HYU76_08555 [Betaproteobacteria bacterium]|nr:hypothetical protein [Betaproteobacteria bacterium]